MDIETIKLLADKFKVSEVYLFGSSVLDYEKAHDIDIGIKGLKPGRFFEFYGKLFMNLSKPVDLVDMDEENSINRIILEEGERIYG
ncbi:MAG: nucleotidyltransferase domain-containing protein [Candidatus Delongbacteria bacterium]|nr:nucleotidyltransferase domain-containing protein [Candidatus Delongbacteria bacterium]